MTCIHAASANIRPAFTKTGRLERVVVGAWRAYWAWRVRRATVRILSSLDARTLKDIGIDPSEITSYAYGQRDHRRRTCEASWRGSSHA